MDTRTTLGIAEATGAYRLNVGELEQLREFIRRHPELLPEKEPGRYDAECLISAVRIIIGSSRYS